MKVINLKGKNYVYGISSTFRPINPSACLAVASKTKKNILITIKVISGENQGVLSDGCYLASAPKYQALIIKQLPLIMKQLPLTIKHLPSSTFVSMRQMGQRSLSVARLC